MSDQVICVDDSDQSFYAEHVVAGRIYTIRQVVEAYFRRGYYFEEIYGGFNDNLIWPERAYEDYRFRPVRDSDLDVFRTIVQTVLEAETV